MRVWIAREWGLVFWRALRVEWEEWWAGRCTYIAGSAVQRTWRSFEAVGDGSL